MSESGSTTGIYQKVAEFLVPRRNLLFGVTVVLCLASLIFAGNIAIDNSLEVWFLESDPTLVAYREFKKIYGNDEIILAMVDCSKGGIFQKETLNALLKASKEIEEDKKNIRRVLSVALSPYIGLQGENELIVEDLMTGEATDDKSVETIRARFMEDPFKVKLLTDKLQGQAILLIEPVAGNDMDVRRPLIIQAVRDKLQGFSFRLAGMGVMYDELNRLSLRDGMVFSGLSYVIIALVIFILYRSWGFLLVVICVMVLGGTSFIGVYGLFHQNFNMVTIVLPTLMMILAISDVAYVYNHYCVNIGKVKEDKEKALIDIYGHCLSPCLFTSVTNAVGFLSIVSSPMLVLRGFGWFAALAAMIEYFISMLSALFVLGFLNPDSVGELARPFAGLVESVVRAVPRYHKAILVILLASTAFGFYGIFGLLEVDTYSMGFLHESNPVRVDSDNVEKVYGNYLPLEVRLLASGELGIQDPEFISRLSRTHDDLEALPGVQRAASIVDVLKKINQVMSQGGASSSYVVPDSANGISQAIMFYGSDPDNDLEYMTNPPSFTEARLTVRVPMVSASGLRGYEMKVKEVLDRNFASMPVQIIFGGYVPLYSRIINYITSSQVSSFGLALIFIFGPMALIFKRFSALWLGVIPNVFPIIMTLGMMGWLGIRLDIASVTIASIALGVAVDDTIHELFLFFDPARKNLDPVESISECIIEAGPAVVSTSIIYALGFSALILASIKSVMLFGGLLALTLVFGMFCEITILPAIICYFRGHLIRARETSWM